MNDQVDLFEPVDPRALARAVDPATSKMAAASVPTFHSDHQRKIYNALAGMKDGTFYEIAEKAKMTDASVWRRLNELEKSGHIVTTGEERPGPTGRMCRVWSVNQTGVLEPGLR